MKIAIIGGSIAGSALGLLLKDNNRFEIKIFERAKDLKSRGAGITLSKELFQTLIAKDMIDKETICYHNSSRSFYCQSPNKPDYGDCIWQGMSHSKRWSRYLVIDFGHPWPKSTRQRAKCLAATVLRPARCPDRASVCLPQ